MPDNYRQKIERIQAIHNYILGLIQAIPGIVINGKTFESFVNCQDYPGCFVLYADGEASGVREVSNYIIHFDIVIKNRLENELDNLDIVKLVLEKLEDYQLGKNCIKCTPGFTKTYYDAIGETKSVQTVITLDIEI